MTNQSRWFRMASLAAKLAVTAAGLSYNTTAAMLVGEIIAMATETGNGLKTLEKKIDSLIISDYFVAIDFLEQVLDVNKSEADRLYVIRRAEELFKLSYFRLLNAEMYVESATSAGMCGILFYATRNYGEANKWFVNAEQGFLKAIKATKEPVAMNGVGAASVGVTIWAGIAGGPLGVFVCLSSCAFAAFETNRYGNSKEYKELRKEYAKFMADIQDNIVSMQMEAKNVLELKAKAESVSELPEA